MHPQKTVDHSIEVSPELHLIPQALGNKTICPYCESTSCSKAGFKRDKQRYKCKHCKKQFVLNPNCPRYETPIQFDFNVDIWLAEHLGLRTNQYKRTNKFIFLNIKQIWLKEHIKKYIYYSANQKSFSSLQAYLSSLRLFSDFILNRPDLKDISQIDRTVIVDYVCYLNSDTHLANESKRLKMLALSDFLRVGTINEWFHVPPYLIRPEDLAPKSKSVPRYIPEEVIKQLNQNINNLPSPIIRMTLLLQECGLRIGELCQLPFDCLKSDTRGNWWIQFKRWKMKKEDVLPISVEAAKLIIEQQEYVQKSLGRGFGYLFCSRNHNNTKFEPVAKVMGSKEFINYLKRLAQDFEIKDSSGKRWNFQTHQFRHTVGTRMINSGVPQHIIQRYLGHQSPTMTAVYAHIHDDTLRKEIEKYHETRVVNFQGETAELEETVLASGDDLAWFKKTVQARALEHGYCARPKLLGDCDIPGFDGCYNCPHWRTNKNFLPILKDTLQRTESVLNKARNCGWELQVKKNEPVKANLEKVIKSLEAAS